MTPETETVSAAAEKSAAGAMEARGFEWRGQPRIPRAATVQLREALVPMLLWTSVPVTRRVDEDLTIVDRFMLEAAFTLAPMRADDVEEVTQIPRDAVLRIAGRLTALGLLTAGDTGFHAVADAAREALHKQAVPRYTTAHLAFLYLPDGDDLIAFASGPGQTTPPILHRAEPVADRELPSEASGRLLAEFIGDRIRSGRVARLPDDIVGAHSDNPHLIPATCHVYRCAGHVRRSGAEVTLALEIKSASGKKEKCAIPGASGQAELWEGITARAPDAAGDWGGMIVTVREAPARWRFTLDREAAGWAARAGVAVSRPGGLSIAEPPLCIVEAEIAFEPSSQDAAVVFALDHAVRELTDTAHPHLTGDAAAAAAATARQQYHLEDSVLTSADVERRLWDESYFRHVYALREPSDFAYD